MKGDPVMFGYAAKFNELSQDLGGFRERIAPGAFTRSLKDVKDIKMLWSHDDRLVLASRAAGTLRLRETPKGLEVEAFPGADRSFARDAYLSVARGEQVKMSFGFKVRRDSWATRAAGLPIRTLEDVDLVEISLVSWPAYEGTVMGVGSPDKFNANVRDYEVIGGYSRTVAEDLVARDLGWRIVPYGENDLKQLPAAKKELPAQSHRVVVKQLVTEADRAARAAARRRRLELVMLGG